MRVLGTGGIGQVWEAILHGPAGFRKPVALKRLRPGAVVGHLRDTLVTEARTGALLQHPNLVSILELGEADGEWFVAMELVRGVPPMELAPGPLPPAAVVEIGVQACAGLAHVHALEVDGRSAALVHRDVKPGNLLVDRNGLVRITDLGLASVAGATSDGSGTPGYAPPEQLRGRAEARSDLFALGATLYALATRRKPFGAGRPAASAVFDVERRLADPTFLAPVDAAAPGLGRVVRRCLRLDPEERWADALELREALRALAPGLAGPSLGELCAAPTPSGAPGRPNRTPSAGMPTVLRSRGNVGTAVDATFGRAAEREALASRLRSGERLVTVLGPGGMGKTRLALDTARALADEWAGGAWFCDLSDAASPEGLSAAVAKALGVPLEGDPVERVGGVLRGLGRALVVLDNFEQAAAHAPATVGRWREVAPEVHLLVTTRIALRLRGEDLFPLDPLDGDAAAALFRARAGVPIPATAPVAELAARLDGHPLAIELAAARARVLPVEAILARLDDRFRLLAGGTADLPERHRSLRASLDASFELLPAWARAAFAQLSVFVGGFTAEGAEAVVDVPGAPWTLDALAVLADHALIRHDRWRFRMLVMVQEYAASHLDDVQRARAEVRHGKYYGQLGTEASLAAAARSPEAEEQLEAELENLVAAARRALARGEVPVAEATVLAASAPLLRLGPLSVAVELGEAAVRARGSRRGPVARALAEALLGVGRLDEAEALIAAELVDGAGAPDAAFLAASGTVAEMRGRPDDAVARYREALARTTDPRQVAEIEGRLGIVLRVLGRTDEARETQERALARARAVGDRRTTSNVLGSLGYLHVLQGRREEGIACLHDAAVEARACRMPRMQAIHLGNLANAHLVGGDLAAAEEVLRESVRLLRRVGEARWEAVQARNLGPILLHLGRFREAAATIGPPLAVFRAAGDDRNVGITLGVQCWVAVLVGAPIDAEQGWAEALDHLARVGDRREHALHQARRAIVRQLSGRLPEALDDAEEALAVARAIGDHATASSAASAKADALVGLRRLDEADAAVAVVEELERIPTARTRLPRARTLLARGEVARALEELAASGRPPDVVLRVRCLALRASLDDAEAAAELRRTVAELPPHALLARIAASGG